jgi:hypothetical protein
VVLEVCAEVDIRVSLPGGELVEGVIHAVLDDCTDGVRYQVAFGHDQTALIGEWQIVKDQPDQLYRIGRRHPESSQVSKTGQRTVL